MAEVLRRVILVDDCSAPAWAVSYLKTRFPGHAVKQIALLYGKGASESQIVASLNETMVLMTDSEGLSAKARARGVRTFLWDPFNADLVEVS